ncbi:MAG: toll/interleukin-1 receptor domain-containing protein, partial [Pelodictyon phaeoclathratiforme]
NWKLMIIEAIKECSHFLALLSSISVSKSGFVRKELKIALDLLDEYSHSDVFIIPIRIDDCEPTDERIKELHWVDLFPSYEAGFQKVLKSILIENDKEEFSKANEQLVLPNQSHLIGSEANRPEETTVERLFQITQHLRNWVEAATPEAKLNEAESLVADVEMAVMMVRTQAIGYEALLRSVKALVEEQRAALQAEIDLKRTDLAQMPKGFSTDNLDRHLAEKMLQFAIRSRQNDIGKLDIMMGPLAAFWGKLV